MTESAVDPKEVEARRRERIWRLSGIELPRMRVMGTVLLSLAIYVSNRFVLPNETSMRGWALATTVLAVYAAVSWLVIAAFLRRDPPLDLTLPFLVGDLPVWTFAIYHSGGDGSWLFFILLLRVADQVQTTFRRAMFFAICATACYASLLAWVVIVDGHDIGLQVFISKVVLTLFAGIYIALVARTAESRRVQLTQHVRMSRDLIRKAEEAHARAQQASAAKSEFVANMSHEMRTPLQGVIGMLQLAIEDEPAEATARRLETARRSAETLMAMIDDVLDFARIEARKLELEPVYFSIRALMAETMKSIAALAASKELTLSYFVQANCPDSVWGDPIRLRQILVNLVGNAIKFTHAGEISVTVARAGDRIRFDVRDTGVGIAPAIRREIFEPFTQADSSLSRRYGGAGLGLSIVVRLLEAMDGTVNVTSEPGAGSVFSFSLPLASDAVGAAPDREPWEASLAGRSIAIVEPAEMARAAIAEMLRSRGVFASAFARVSDAPAGRFACAVTSDPSIDVRPQVVIASPLDPVAHEIQITRPVVERELVNAVGLALGLSGRAPQYTLRPRPHADTAVRVLLVDDNEVNREVVAEMLRRLGHVVSTAADGEQALAIVAGTRFDAVFMDVQLPGIDGLEVTRRLRVTNPGLPVIGVTAHTSRADRDRCLVAGMNSVLTKPVSAQQLDAALAAVRGRDPLSEITGDNPALLARVRDAFARQTPELLAGIRDALSASDQEAVVRHAHKLKGSLSYFEGEAVKLARDIELAAREGQLGRAASLLPNLESAVAAVARNLAGHGA